MARRLGRREIVRIIRKKAREDKKKKEIDEVAWESNTGNIENLAFLRDLEEGRIKGLNGKKIC